MIYQQYEPHIGKVFLEKIGLTIFIKYGRNFGPRLKTKYIKIPTAFNHKHSLWIKRKIGMTACQKTKEIKENHEVFK